MSDRSYNNRAIASTFRRENIARLWAESGAVAGSPKRARHGTYSAKDDAPKLGLIIGRTLHGVVLKKI